jgi:hypothetical protein
LIGLTFGGALSPVSPISGTPSLALNFLNVSTKIDSMQSPISRSLVFFSSTCLHSFTTSAERTQIFQEEFLMKKKMLPCVSMSTIHQMKRK